MIVNLPVHTMSEKCMNCPELEIDVVTTEKFDTKQLKNGMTISELTGFENVLNCKNWNDAREYCPVMNRCKAILDAVKETAVEAVVASAEPEKKPAVKKTTTKTTAVKKTTTKKATAKK